MDIVYAILDSTLSVDSIIGIASFIKKPNLVAYREPMLSKKINEPRYYWKCHYRIKSEVPYTKELKILIKNSNEAIKYTHICKYEDHHMSQICDEFYTIQDAKQILLETLPNDIDSNGPFFLLQTNMKIGDF